MSNEQTGNDVVAKQVIEYIDKVVTEKYKKGEISSNGLLKAKKTVEIRIPASGGRYDRRGFSSFETNYGEARLKADKSFFSVIRTICKSKRITVRDCYSGGSLHSYIWFSVPLEYVESLIHKTEAEIQQFAFVINNRRHEVVIELADAIISNQNRFAGGIYLDKPGLYGDKDGECASSILLFKELGLENIDNSLKVEVLANAIKEQLNKIENEVYEVKRIHLEHLDKARYYFDKVSSEENNTPLSKW